MLRKCIITGICLMMLCTAASASQALDILMDVTLRDDGSAHFEQQWFTLARRGTEFYVPMRDNGYLVPYNFTVSDEEGVYETIDDWDVDASFEEKARRCGIHWIDNGWEFCWGITRYGLYEYTVSYDLDNLVGSYEDADGFNFRFINQRMDTFPTRAKITIHTEDGTPLTDENCNIWGFGFPGTVEFLPDGSIYAATSEQMADDDRMTVMVEFNKGVLHPKRHMEGTFEAVKELAFDGSDYEQDMPTLLDKILTVLLFYILPAVILLAMIAYAIWNICKLCARYRLLKVRRYCRRQPDQKNLLQDYVLTHTVKQAKGENLIACVMLQLCHEGNIKTVKIEFPGKVFYHIIEKIEIYFEEEPEDALKKQLYYILRDAAEPDDVLHEKDLERYAKKNPEALQKWLDACEAEGRKACDAAGFFDEKTGKRLLNWLTPPGEYRIKALMGLKKYIMDFTLLKERNVTESIIWEDYMIYTLLFGLSEKVMRELYVQHLGELELMPKYEEYKQIIRASREYSHSSYAAMCEGKKVLEGLARAAGSGGSSSRSGGSGDAGGASGGGTR